MKSAIVYRGPSLLDGQPIVGIVSFGSDNKKTGDTAQLWIMLESEAPHHAVKSGNDVSVCGDCIHRPALIKAGRDEAKAKRTKYTGPIACYVKTFQAPLALFGALQRGTLDVMTLEECSAILAGFKLRLGAYGDPAALPRHVIEALCANTRGILGYSHQWKRNEFSWLSQYCMASVDKAADLLLARALGWRSFYVRDDSELDLVPDNAVKQCPAAKEVGAKVTCSACMACGGLSSLAKNDRAINQH